MLGVSADGALEEFDLSLKKSAQDAKLTTSQILVLAAQFPQFAAGLNTLIGVVTGKSLDDLQRDVDTAKDKLRDAYQDEAGLLQDVVEKSKAAAKSIRAFLASLDTGSLSPLSPYDKLQSAAGEFARVSQLAMGGDQDALGKLQDVSQTYLEDARDYYASSTEYFRIFSDVKAVLDQTATKTDQQVSAAQMQLDALNTQISALIDIKLGGDLHRGCGAGGCGSDCQSCCHSGCASCWQDRQ